MGIGLYTENTISAWSPGMESQEVLGCYGEELAKLQQLQKVPGIAIRPTLALRAIVARIPVTILTQSQAILIQS